MNNNQIVCADDDLKRLKDECKRREKYNISSADGMLIRIQFEALLARMEAGEICLEAANQEGGIDSSLYETWRAACGKGNI